ncbi:ATPase, E1-E2 type [Bdellovibrio bacteriovorus W]|nr:ATPase, E1-E2 type [Bdellovibrio bacteriovorus W]
MEHEILSFSKKENERQFQGLSRSFALQRLDEEGFNELPTSKARRSHQIIWNILKEPMIYLLLGCGAIYFFLGDRQEATILLAFLLLIIGIEFFQEQKAEQSLEALRELSSPRALILRDGKKVRISSREIVREDIIFINEGDKVPADAQVIKSSHLAADESLLTGESMPVSKTNTSKVYAGTTIIAGQGMAFVTAIGANTQIGKIGKSLQETESTNSRLQRETRRLVQKVAVISVLICIAVFITFAITRNDWLEGFLAGLTLAMAIMPNELPAVLTIFLALGAWRLSKRRVLTRKLPAVENLGAATTLCVDKTGTLTLNKMKIHKLYAQGDFLDLSDSNQKNIPEKFHEALEFGILASRQDPFDPMEIAFLSAGGQFLENTEHLHYDWILEREYPLTPELLAISHAWKTQSDGNYIIGAKGAPEAIIDLCHLESSMSQEISQMAELMASEGLRVLGVAKAIYAEPSLPQIQHDFDFVFVGLIGLADPIRSEVPAAISECHSAGIRVIMITGDHSTTARSIAKRIGLKNSHLVLTGSELSELSKKDLSKRIESINIFSRVSPMQKLQIVEALKSAGEVVAMTGDGVNDAPALKAADIGIAMGQRGTDVARESADLVLLDDDFGSIVESIRMGRRIYSNLRNALQYLFSAHVPIAGMSVFPVIFQSPLVLLPMHIALLHLIIEPASSIAFEIEPASSSTMKKPPRSAHQLLFDKQLWTKSLVSGVGVLIALIFIYQIALSRELGASEARALVFTSLIFSNIALIFLNSSSQKTLTEKVLKNRNRAVEITAFFSILLLLLSLYLPSFRDLMKFSFLHWDDLAICLFLGVSSVLISQGLSTSLIKEK